VSALDPATDSTRRPFSGRRVRLGDLILQTVAGAAALGTAVLLGLIAYKVAQGAKLSLSTFGLGFITHVGWDPVSFRYGAGSLLFGTAVTSLGALVIATPLAIAIGLFLSELAPAGIRGVATALIETLAAIPSVVIGLWGILVLVPLLHDHVDPVIHSALGFIPLFGPAQYGQSIFAAIVVLTIMILPIIASISRELFLGVPSELKEAALGLGATRWEMVRGVILPYTRSGVAAAMILGLGRALGEAIAVAQVIGAFDSGVSWNLFTTGDTLASKIAVQFLNVGSASELSALFYLALILLVLSLIVNLLAQWIVRRLGRQQRLAT